jgi:hypothetical protein
MRAVLDPTAEKCYRQASAVKVIELLRTTCAQLLSYTTPRALRPANLE